MSDAPPYPPIFGFPNPCNLLPVCKAAAAVGARLRQPSSVTGLAALTGVATAYASGQMTGPQAIAAGAGALVAIAIPDNSAAPAAASALLAAAIHANTNRIAAVESHPALLTPTRAKP